MFGMRTWVQVQSCSNLVAEWREVIQVAGNTVQYSTVRAV